MRVLDVVDRGADGDRGRRQLHSHRHHQQSPRGGGARATPLRTGRNRPFHINGSFGVTFMCILYMYSTHALPICLSHLIDFYPSQSIDLTQIGTIFKNLQCVEPNHINHDGAYGVNMNTCHQPKPVIQVDWLPKEPK